MTSTLRAGAFTFLIDDPVKVILAAVILPLVWHSVGAKQKTAAE